MPGKSPSFVTLSLWQTPQACTRMRTCPALGLGISRSTISKSAPGLGTWATFIFAIEDLLFSFGIRRYKLDGRHMQTDSFYSVEEPAGEKGLLSQSQKSFAEISDAMQKHSDCPATCFYAQCCIAANTVAFVPRMKNVPLPLH